MDSNQLIKLHSLSPTKNNESDMLTLAPRSSSHLFICLFICFCSPESSPQNGPTFTVGFPTSTQFSKFLINTLTDQTNLGNSSLSLHSKVSLYCSQSIIKTNDHNWLTCEQVIRWLPAQLIHLKCNFCT